MLVRQEKSRAIMELMTWHDLQFWYDIIRVDQVCELSFYLGLKKKKNQMVGLLFFFFLIQGGLGIILNIQIAPSLTNDGSPWL